LDHSDQGLSSQSTGQDCILHACVSVLSASGGHSLPPFCGSVLILLVPVCVPPPQSLEHGPQSGHSLSSQFTRADGDDGDDGDDFDADGDGANGDGADGDGADGACIVGADVGDDGDGADGDDFDADGDGADGACVVGADVGADGDGADGKRIGTDVGADGKRIGTDVGADGDGVDLADNEIIV